MAQRTLIRFAPLAALLAIACNDKALSSAPPTDRFYFPTGLAIHHQPPGCTGGTAGCQTQLLVVSSNYDLAYDATTGGTLISVDVGQALAQAAAGVPSPVPFTPLGAVRIGSFGGELAIVDPETCPTWSGPAQALVASRSQTKLYRVDVDAQGGLSCGADCVVPLDTSSADPYGVTVACGSFAPAAGMSPAPQAFAFVTYLRAVDAHGWLSQIDLQATDATGRRSSPITKLDLQAAPTGHAVFDPASTRLYVTGRFTSTADLTPLRWLELATPGAALGSVNLATALRGVETRGMAISTDRSRAYLAVRFYNADVAASYGVRPVADLAGALLVLDLDALSSAIPELRILRVVPLDRGATEVRVIARPPGQRDVVAVTALDDSTVTLYDDEAGAVATELSLCGGTDANGASAPPPCSAGTPLVGAEPFGMAVEPLSGGAVRLYVGSFDRSWVNVLQIDPRHPTAAPAGWVRIGPERP